MSLPWLKNHSLHSSTGGDKCVVLDKDPGEDLLTCERTIAEVDLRGPFQHGTSVADPGSDAFFTPGSGKIFSRSRILNLKSQIPKQYF